jgi:hypothetical protein
MQSEKEKQQLGLPTFDRFSLKNLHFYNTSSPQQFEHWAIGNSRAATRHG